MLCQSHVSNVTHGKGHPETPLQRIILVIVGVTGKNKEAFVPPGSVSIKDVVQVQHLGQNFVGALQIPVLEIDTANDVEHADPL